MIGLKPCTRNFSAWGPIKVQAQWRSLSIRISVYFIFLFFAFVFYFASFQATRRVHLLKLIFLGFRTSYLGTSTALGPSVGYTTRDVRVRVGTQVLQNVIWMPDRNRYETLVLTPILVILDKISPFISLSSLDFFRSTLNCCLIFKFLTYIVKMLL